MLVVALALRPRLRGRPGHDPVNPIVAARFAVLALACSRAGALFVGVYAAQRFLWEFIKPYGTVIGPFNLFHLICLGLLAYAWSYGRAELRYG